MHEVVELFPNVRCRTHLWVSDAVLDRLNKRARKHQQSIARFLTVLKRYVQNGFACYEGPGHPVRHEGDGVYRIGHHDLFRVIGFYEDDSRRDFIAIGCFLKRRQALNAAERRRIKDVARVKKEHLWKRRTNGQYPRLADYS